MQTPACIHPSVCPPEGAGNEPFSCCLLPWCLPPEGQGPWENPSQGLEQSGEAACRGKKAHSRKTLPACPSAGFLESQAAGLR